MANTTLQFTVAELIEALKAVPQDYKVVASVGFENSFHVEQAPANVVVEHTDDREVIVGGLQRG